MTATWPTTDEGLARVVRDLCTVYRPGSDGAYRRERLDRLDRLMHTSLRYALACASLRGAESRHIRAGTDSTAEALGRAAARVVLRAQDHLDALGSEVRATREAPRCRCCGHLLTTSDADGWHCARIGCADGQRWLEAQAEHSSRPAAVVDDVTCPECGGPMVERRRKSDGHPFLGCQAFPRCRGVRDGGVL